MKLARRVPAWIWLTLVAAGLRLVNLGSESLWYDEGFTAWLARLDFPSMWTAIRGDVHPPLWYIVEWGIVRVFGVSPFTLRLPAALLSVIAVLLIWRLALALKFDRRTAFIAGLLVAVMPASLYYGQDARMYPLLCCFVIGAVWAAVSDRWLLFALCGIGAVYTQNLGLFYVLVIGLSVALTRGRTWRTLTRPALAGIGVVVGWLPWSSVLSHQASLIKQGFWIQPLSSGGAFYPLVAMTMGVRLPIPSLLYVYGAAFGITFVSLIVCRRWLLTRQGLIVTTAIFGTPAMVALLSIVWKSVYLPRAFLPSALLLMLFWAYTLTHLSMENRAVARLILIPVIGIGVFSHYFPAQGSARFRIPDWTQTIESNWQPGDVVYHVAIDSCILFQFYLQGYPYALMRESNDLNQSLTDETKTAMHLNQSDFDGLIRQGYHRVWLIGNTNALTSASEFAEIANIKAHYHYTVVKTHSFEFAQLTIYLVDLPVTF